MKLPRLLLFGFLVLVGASCQSTSRNQDLPGLNQSFTEMVAPVYRFSLMASGGIDLFYCSLSFRAKNGRFPNDYTELSEFVKQSNGYLVLSQHERVELRPLPGDGLEIRYVRPGRTNEMKIMLGGPDEKK